MGHRYLKKQLKSISSSNVICTNSGIKVVKGIKYIAIIGMRSTTSYCEIYELSLHKIEYLWARRFNRNSEVELNGEARYVKFNIMEICKDSK